VRKIILSILIINLLFISCDFKKDRLVTEVYHYKLYESEVVNNIPSGLSNEDSLQLFTSYIENWIKEKVVLHEAEKVLSIKEKDFDLQLKKYKEQLLISAYYKKITSDSTKFQISDSEIKYFARQFKESEPIQKNVVRVNYVKLSKKSAIGNQIKDILFNETKRISQKNKLIKLCSDSIEYFLDDNQWMLLDYLENDFPFNINNKDALLSEHKYIDVTDDQFRYLVVFIDFKTQYTSSETREEFETTKQMMMQQKKVKYINKIKESLLEKAIKEGTVIQ
jgi:hypothetical protein